MLPATLQFDDTALQVIDREGTPYLTAADLARALGYSAEDAVSRIYRRNADEFTGGMVLTVNLTVNGFGGGVAQKAVTVFNSRGCYAVAMLAKTPRAKAFRRWVLDVLEGQASREAELSALRDRLARLEQALYQDRPAWPVIIQCKRLGKTHAETCDATGHLSTDTIRRNLRRLERYGLAEEGHPATLPLFPASVH